MECEFCKERVESTSHLLECDVVLSHLFAGNISLSCPEETIVDLVTTIKKPNKLPILKWKTISELCNELRGLSNLPNNMMYS